MRSGVLFICLLLCLQAPLCLADDHKTIRVGIFQLEPLNFIDKFGEAKGLYPDLLREMVKQERWRLKFVPGTWKESLQRLENGEIDLLTTIARTPERELKFDYSSESIVDNWSQIFSLPSAGINSFQDLNDIRVAIVSKDINGRNFLETVANMKIEPQILRYENYVDIFAAVQNGEADALVSAQHFGFRHADEYGLVATSLQFAPIPIYFAALKGQQAEVLQHIDQHLAAWKADKNSYYYKRVAYWISNHRTALSIPAWIYGILVISAGLVVVLLIRNRSMHRAKRQRDQAEELHDHILAETAIDGFAKVGMDGRFLQVNDAYEKMIGYSRDELLQMKVSDLEVIETPEEIASHIQHVIKQGRDRFETHHRTKSGQLLNIEISTSFYPGNPPIFYAFYRDITEQKKALQALSESEERFSLAMTATTDGLWDWDIASSEVYYNPSWFAILGLKQGPFRYSTWEERIHPEDKEEVLQSLNLHLAGETEAWQLDHRLRNCDDDYIWVRGRGKVVKRDDNGAPLRMVGTMSDINALQQAERERDRLFNYSLDMLCITGPDGYFQQLNPAWEHTLGWSIEEIKNKPWMELVHPDDHPRTIQAAEQLAKGMPAIGFENRYLCKDGGYRWLSWNTFPLPEEGLLLGIARDVTAAKQDAEHRQKLEEQLRRSQKMEAIGTLAGGIAHDFNNILTPIIAHATMAKRKIGDDSPLQNHLIQIEKSVQRAADLVKQILTISRKEKEIEATTDLRIMLTEIINFIRASLPTTIAIDLQLSDAPLTVAADSNQVHQIILNLCTNAKDAMDGTGGTLTLAAHPVTLADGRQMINLSVTDSGEGIAEEVQQRIFDPYFTTKKFGKGSGLGLAVVHGIVTSLEGEIKVSSRAEQGTTFEILLPAANSGSKAPSIKPGQLVSGKGEHILLIDDEEQITETIKMLLEELGYRVTAYHSSQAAFDAFSSATEDFDAILTDQTMPELTGLNLAKKISRLRPDIPILLGTGYLEGINPETAHQHGVAKLLHKPYELEVLSAAFAQIFPNRLKDSSPAQP